MRMAAPPRRPATRLVLIGCLRSVERKPSCLLLARFPTGLTPTSSALPQLACEPRTVGHFPNHGVRREIPLNLARARVARLPRQEAFRGLIQNVIRQELHLKESRSREQELLAKLLHVGWAEYVDPVNLPNPSAGQGLSVSPFDGALKPLFAAKHQRRLAPRDQVQCYLLERRQVQIGELREVSPGFPDQDSPDPDETLVRPFD